MKWLAIPVTWSQFGTVPRVLTRALGAQPGRPAMLNIGLDLHKRETQSCIVDASGTIQLERRRPTTRPAFTALLGGGSRARILREAGTESEGVAQHLEAFG